MEMPNTKEFNARRIYLGQMLVDCIEDINLSGLRNLLEEYNADPNVLLPGVNYSPVHAVAGSENEQFALEAMILLMDHRGDPNIKGDEDLTPVHVAASWGHTKVLQILLERGGLPSICDECGKTPLDYAKENNEHEAVRIISEFFNKKDTKKNCRKSAMSTLRDRMKAIRCVNQEYLSKMKKSSVLSEIAALPSTSSSEYGSTLGTNSLSSLPPSESVISEDHKTESKSSKAPRIRMSIARSIIMPPIIPEIKITRPSSQFANEFTEEQLAYHNSPKNVRPENLDEGSTVNNNVEQWLSDVNHFMEGRENSMGPDQTCENSTDKNLIQESTTKDSSCEQTDSSARTLTTVSECYKYADEKEGIVLLEERLIPNHDQLSDFAGTDTSGCSSVIFPTEAETSDTENLRGQLKKHGIFYGPVTKTTKKIYKHQLHVKKKYNRTVVRPECLYCSELQRTLKENNPMYFLSRGANLEQRIAAQFAQKKDLYNWREGNLKTSFNYLLLDPRITKNLPALAGSLPEKQLWALFLKSIFYIGKGKRSRPYAHLYEAVQKWNKKKYRYCSTKVKRIIEIWQDELGVICLHVFQNIMPVEAYTREAAMIDAIGLQNLCNLKRSEYYGIAAHWFSQDQRIFGVHLLYKAMKIFLLEGERHLRPWDIVEIN